MTPTEQKAFDQMRAALEEANKFVTLDSIEAALTAAKEVQAQVEPTRLLSTTQDLARGIAKRCYPDVPLFEVLDDLAGVISQIDNMTTGMERKATPQAQRLSDAEKEDVYRHMPEFNQWVFSDAIAKYARAIETAFAAKNGIHLGD